MVLGFAQNATISGVVQGDEGALELATVSLLKTSYAASTDSTGRYTLNVPAGKYQLRVSYVGFENFQTEVVVKDGATIEVHPTLVPLASRLKEVVVTGTLKEVRTSESVTAVDVYSQKYFERNPVTNLFEGRCR